MSQIKDRKQGLNVNAEEYDVFRDFLAKACGITLGENKHYLVSSRLTSLLNELKIDCLQELVKQAQLRTALKSRIIDAMTTNETFWFRDNYPFESLKSVIFPELRKRKTPTVRIWSAACSTGQEPYSISMALHEYLVSNPGAPLRLQVTATDISPTVLKEAAQARYDRAAVVRGLSTERRNRFFEQQGDFWQLRKEVRERVTFRDINLLQSYSLLGKFQVIFCRNVLIYFAAPAKEDIIKRMSDCLEPGGYLMLGSSESVSSFSSAFETVRANGGILYRKK